MTQVIDLGKLRFSFAGDWNSSTTYETNDIVKYGGNVYVYTYGLKTSTQLPTNTVYWALMVEGIKFKGVFSSATAYKVGDAIAHGGKVYIAVIDTTGNTPPNTTYWSQFADGIQYEGVYSNVGTYQKNDVVSYGSSGYIALQDTSGNLPTNATFWAKLIEGVSVSGAWSSATAYVPNDLVAYGANQYKAIANNTNQLPINATGVLNSGFWTLQTEGVRSRGEWATGTEYYINDVVSHGGNSYIAIVRNAATAFTADLAANKWIKFNSGVRWRGDWAASTSYFKDDIIKDGVGSAYIATIDHSSGSNFSTDSLAGKWVVFVRGGTDVLPPILAGDAGQSLTVKGNGADLDWIGATESNKVFYVAPHGVDGSAYGKNMSTPFASLKYATTVCGEGATIFVKTGTYSEQLPIIIPANTAIVGDSQRTVFVEPKAGLSDDGVTPNNQASMFLMSNASILNRMTFKGMTGWVPGSTPSDITTSVIKGVVVRLNPASPITHKSPYVLECSFIGSGAIGALVDGSVHTTGNKSIIFHAYTVISDNGVGYWIKDGAKSEIVSCFTYFAYFGYTATGGGFIRALNGNNSYGTWGATSRGFDVSETAITGTLVGEQLPFTYGGGSINIGDTATATGSAVPAVQYTVTTVANPAGAGSIYQINGANNPALTLTRGGVYTFDLSDTSVTGHPLAFKDGAGASYTTGVVATGTPGQAGAKVVFTVPNNAPSSLRYYCTVHGDGMGNTITATGLGAVNGFLITATATVTNVQYSADKVYIKNRTGTFAGAQPLTFTGGGTGVTLGAAEGQRGFVLVATGFTELPRPGASISIAGDTYSYVIQSTTNTWVNSGSEIVLLLSQEKPSGSGPGTGVTIRYKYSQIRLTGHDFLSIGTGGTATTNYPGTPTQPAAQGNEVDESFPGRVYYVSTDQDGNFRVGEYFRIDQSTGKATLNASAFDLSGLSSLRLGSIGAQLGEQINEFSSDATLSGNSNLAIPTEYAVKTYVDSQIGSVSVSSIPFLNTISTNRSAPAGTMTFSMGTLTLAGSSVYTIPTGTFHFVMNPDGFALFQ